MIELHWNRPALPDEKSKPHLSCPFLWKYPLVAGLLKLASYFKRI